MVICSELCESLSEPLWLKKFYHKEHKGLHEGHKKRFAGKVKDISPKKNAGELFAHAIS
jgi:hypothetical protein